MTGVFRQKTPSNTVLLFLLGVLLKLPVFFHPKGYILKENDGFVYQNLISILDKTFNHNPVIFVLISFFINMAVATMLNHFMNANRLMTKSNYLAGMAYLLITSFLPAFNLLSSNLIASVFLFSAFIVFVKSTNVKYDKNNIYNTSFLVGLGSLFFFPAIAFIVWCCIALIIFKPFRLSNWIILLLGLTTPYYFYAAFLFLTDNFQIPQYFEHISILETKIQYTIWHAITFFLLLTPLLAGLFYMQANSGKMTVNARKVWYLVLWYLTLGIVIALFNIGKTSENLIILLLPLSAFHGYGYLNAELKIYSKVAFWLSVAFVVAAQLYSPIWS